MTRIAALIRATHALPAAAVTLITGALLAGRGASAGTLGWAVLSTAAGQASVGWSNDFYDRERDALAGRTEKPLIAGAIAPSTLRWGAVAAVAVALAAAIPLGPAAVMVMSIAVASAWVYNISLKGTVLSWLPYAVSFALLPVFVGAVTNDAPPWWIVAGGALLGVAGHLMNVLPDLERDPGVRGLPHLLGPRRSIVAAAVLLASAIAMVLVVTDAGGSRGALATGAVGGALAIGSVMAAIRGRPRVGFALTIAVAGAVVGVVLLAPHGW